jgi:outer membrane protein insertion porin family
MRICYSLLILIFSTLGHAASPTIQLAPQSFAIVKNLTGAKKNNFTMEQLNLIVKEISTQKDYEIIRFINHNGELVLDLRESAGTQQIKIVGNQAITRDQIMKILGLNDTKRINKFEVQKNLAKLQDKYEALGLRKVEINLREDNENSELTYTVEINEGHKATLDDIIVLSNNKYLNNYIRFILSPKRNRKIDSELIKEIETTVNEILINNRVLNARIARVSPIYNQERTSAKLTITLESTSTYELVFYGNKYFSSNSIISSLDIDTNYLNYIKNKKLFTRNIEDLYRSHGFPNISVDSETFLVDKEDKYIIRFKITEGAQIRVRNIKVSGKISRPPSYYENMINNSLSEMNNSSLFVEDNIEKAVEKTIVKLKDEGYLRAEKVSIDSQINAYNSADINIQINENLLTQIRSIQFLGLKSFTSNQLYEVIDLKPNSPLNLKKVADSFSALSVFYQKNGYLEFAIETPKEKLINYVDNFEFADLTYNIKEGPQIRVKEIQVRGNTFTKEKVILRELDMEPGDILTSDTVSDSVLYLERTQLFGRAQINTEPANTMISDRTVFVDIQEKNPGVFSSGIGLTNERGLTYRGYLGIAYRNLGGTGRGISARADVKYSNVEYIQYPENRVVLGYYEPYLFFERLRLRVSGTHEQQVYDISSTNVVRIQEINEITFIMEKQINRRLKLFWHLWDYSALNTFDKDNHADENKINIASFGPAMELDRRDDIFTPRAGTFTNARLEYANPAIGSSNNANNDINFFRATAGHITYLPITSNKRWVFVTDVRGGYVENLSSSDQSGVPSSRLFFLGGRSTIRGYDLRKSERVPTLQEICATCSALDKFKAKESSEFFLLKSEVRFPVYGDFGGLVFYDGGAVYIKGINITDHYRDSAGFGIRYITPIGAFTAELGFKLDRRNAIPGSTGRNEDPYAFHISMGNF